jgi:hypothetical protein
MSSRHCFRDKRDKHAAHDDNDYNQAYDYYFNSSAIRYGLRQDIRHKLRS